ncbi:MAG: hypothetical protein JNM43_25635 [Planctomycetaceae bacterium]|nr:hypothetical protein [Planctomycetaceae bacterium]
MNRSLRLILIWTALITLTVRNVSAADDTVYTVHVSPFMQIDAMTADRTATHPLTAGNVSFTNNRWFARTSSGTGSTVRFSTDHAFQHVASPSSQRDARLTLTNMVGNSSGRWQYDVVTDVTNYAAGDGTATVQVSSRAPGTAIITMRVDFLTGTASTLRQGQYQMTVIGTISEN